MTDERSAPEGATRLTAALADRYRVERELGAGGMATVYLAHDIKHDRQVAIKVLKPELGAVLGAERFLSEIKVTANLQSWGGDQCGGDDPRAAAVEDAPAIARPQRFAATASRDRHPAALSCQGAHIDFLPA